VRRAGLRAAARVGRMRRSATGVPEEWSSPLPDQGAGQNPAYKPSGAGFFVDALADQIGISAVSGGQPCGSPILVLLVEKDRLASPIVWSTQCLAAVTQDRK
jgi:hypothetical protein